METSYPKTFAEAVDWVLAQLDDANKAAFKALPEKDMRAMMHFNLSLYVRNKLIFNNPDSAAMLHMWFPGEWYVHPDTVSGDVVEGAWRKLNGLPFLKRMTDEEFLQANADNLNTTEGSQL